MKTKKLQLLSVATLALLLAVTSCSKKDSAPAATAQFSATLGGAAYQPSIVAAFAQFSYINIQGLQLKSGDSLSLQLSIPDTATVNSKLTFDDVELDYFNMKGTIEYYSYYSPSHGTVTFTTLDKTNKKIAGKFTGVIYTGGSRNDSLVVTNGQFNTTWQ